MITNLEIEKLNLLLEPMIGTAYLDRWWTSPNAGFNGRCPAMCDYEEVKEYLLHHAFVGGGS